MTPKAVLLDTSFFLRFLNDSDPLFENADGYFRYFIQQEVNMVISTISIAEYCVGGDLNELPLRNLQILPFNLNHAKRTGTFARIVFRNKEEAIEYYLSSDTESLKIFNLLKKETDPGFQFIDLNTPYHQTFSILDL